MSNEEIVKRIQEGEDRKENLSLLWECNQRLIDSIVRSLTGLQSYEEGFEDAKQQSYFGLLEAVERYRPESGVKFFSYAGGRIRKAIYRYHANTGYVVRVPEYLRYRVKRYARFCREYKTQNGTWPDDEICMKSLHISRKGLEHLKKLNCEMSVMSLEEETGEGRTLADSIPGVDSLEETITGSVYRKELHETLSKALCLLPAEEKEILLLHFYQGYQIKAIGRMKGLARQTVYNRLNESYRRIRESEFREELETFRERPFREPEERKERKSDFQDVSKDERGLLL